MCDNLTLPFKDCSLDAVLSIAVIHHFSTTERRVCALRELARVLRIGGRIIITVWAMERRHRKVLTTHILSIVNNSHVIMFILIFLFFSSNLKTF